MSSKREKKQKHKIAIPAYIAVLIDASEGECEDGIEVYIRNGRVVRNSSKHERWVYHTIKYIPAVNYLFFYRVIYIHRENGDGIVASRNRMKYPKIAVNHLYSLIRETHGASLAKQVEHEGTILDRSIQDIVLDWDQLESFYRRKDQPEIDLRFTQVFTYDDVKTRVVRALDHCGYTTKVSKDKKVSKNRKK